MKSDLIQRCFTVLVLVGVVSAMVARGSPRIANAQAPSTGRACLRVAHGYIPTPEEDPDRTWDWVAVAEASPNSSYSVEYQLLNSMTRQPTSDWQTAIESPYDGDEDGIFEYAYDTHVEALGNIVEWRITTSSHSGTDVNTLDSMVSMDTSTPEYQTSALFPTTNCPLDTAPRSVIMYQHAP